MAIQIYLNSVAMAAGGMKTGSAVSSTSILTAGRRSPPLITKTNSLVIVFSNYRLPAVFETSSVHRVATLVVTSGCWFCELRGPLQIP